MLMALAIISTLSVIPTLINLITALKDRRARARSRENGELAALAREAVIQESLRVLIHVLLASGIWSLPEATPFRTLISTPVPSLIMISCWLTAFSSMLSLHFRRQREARYRRKEMAKQAAQNG